MRKLFLSIFAFLAITGLIIVRNANIEARNHEATWDRLLAEQKTTQVVSTATPSPRPALKAATIAYTPSPTVVPEVKTNLVDCPVKDEGFVTPQRCQELVDQYIALLRELGEINTRIAQQDVELFELQTQKMLYEFQQNNPVPTYQPIVLEPMPTSKPLTITVEPTCEPQPIMQGGAVGYSCL